MDGRGERGGDQFRQAIWNLRSVRSAFGPLPAVPMMLRKMFFALAIEVLADQQIRCAIFAAIDVFADRGPGSGPLVGRFAVLFAFGFRRLEWRQSKFVAHKVFALDRIVAGETVDEESIRCTWVDLQAHGTIRS